MRDYFKEHEGSGFSPEETDRIMEEAGPVNDRVVEATKEAVKQYVKVTPSMFSSRHEEDDELPF